MLHKMGQGSIPEPKRNPLTFHILLPNARDHLKHWLAKRLE
jgi:hypothetical protein